jgi:hypothetical protein
MTRKLEQLFDLADSEDIAITEEVLLPKEHTPEEIQKQITIADKIDAALPSVNDLEVSDQEMDHIASEAQKTFHDLMDLGMNVEARFAGDIFNNATKMLDTALSAKAHKVNKKLKMVQLQLQKATLDQKERRNNERNNDMHGTEDGSGVVLDRNELLREILAKKE